MSDVPSSELPPELVALRDALVAEIYAAFQGVTRDGGVSWGESWDIDMYGNPEPRIAAGIEDRDSQWSDLVDDSSWRPDGGVGGWAFLDSIGFRYYLPAAMIRSINTAVDSGLCYWLTLSNTSEPTWWLEKWSALDDRQTACVQRFLQYLEAFAFAMNLDSLFDDSEMALHSYWGTLSPHGL